MSVFRRFLVAPSLVRLLRKERGGSRITEGYFAPQAGRTSFVRAQGTNCFLVLVTGVDGAQVEERTEVPRAHGDALLDVCAGKVVFERTAVALGGAEAQIDRYVRPAGLDLVSLVFDNAEAAKGFVPPVWFGAEVSADRAYEGQSIALTGVPTPGEIPLSNAALDAVLDLIEPRFGTGRPTPPPVPPKPPAPKESAVPPPKPAEPPPPAPVPSASAVPVAAAAAPAAAKPEEQPKPAEPPPAAEPPKAAEAPKPAEPPKAAETPKPAEAPKAAEPPKPAEAPKPAESPKAEEPPKPAEPPKAPAAPPKPEPAQAVPAEAKAEKAPEPPAPAKPPEPPKAEQPPVPPAPEVKPAPAPAEPAKPAPVAETKAESPPAPAKDAVKAPENEPAKEAPKEPAKPEAAPKPPEAQPAPAAAAAVVAAPEAGDRLPPDARIDDVIESLSKALGAAIRNPQEPGGDEGVAEAFERWQVRPRRTQQT